MTSLGNKVVKPTHPVSGCPDQVQGSGGQVQGQGVSAGSGRSGVGLRGSGAGRGSGAWLGRAYERKQGAEKPVPKRLGKEGLRQMPSTRVHSSSIHGCRKVEITNQRMDGKIQIMV